MTAGIGGGQSQASSSASENVWGPQGQALGNLYDQAGKLINDPNQAAMMRNYQNQAQNLDPYNQQLMQNAMGGQQQMLSGGSIGDTSDIRANLMSSLDRSQQGSNLGRMYQSIVGGAGNTYIDPMVDAMTSGYQENLDRNLAGGSQEASYLGQGGSSRHAMSDAMLKRGSMRDMSNMESMMRGSAYDKDLAMKMGIASQADQGIQSSQQRMMELLGMSDRNVGAGMGHGQGMQDLGLGSMTPQMQAMQAPWQMMQQYGNVVGGPTVLGSAESDSSAWNAEVGA